MVNMNIKSAQQCLEIAACAEKIRKSGEFPRLDEFLTRLQTTAQLASVFFDAAGRAITDLKNMCTPLLTLGAYNKNLGRALQELEKALL